ncbi:hypothetical protein BIU98_09150 [Curtobacterium sp. MMLR14_010]|uniref:hypothetical protein n=1 Tax=Curtobacterium sp. MMLR14_010 TaxID=1898743 RepID=UPI0008DE5CE6|nr:hypothetical protein [Curtobacterium sp. MMLR14_010]OII31891.1 hypothetical protein BIU98_09150 [Curtobacterium sp. MMLR14_010]
MSTDTRALSRLATEVVLAVPGVRSVVLPGPSLAVLVRDVRSVLDLLPRDGGAVLVEDRSTGLRVRVVLTVDAGVSAITTLRSVRDELGVCIEHATGARADDVTVRVVEIT